jgi:amino acid adenylation domain-containing protein
LSAIELVDRLDTLGVALVADGGRLRVTAARGQLTDDLKQAIAAHKTELLRLLAARDAHVRAVQAVPRSGALPLSYFQERLWVLDCLEPDNTAFNLATRWASDTPIDAHRLAAAIASVVARHEVLRATFVDEGGSPVMRVLPADTVPIRIHDLGPYSEVEQRCRLDAALLASTRLRFELATQPPARFDIYRLGAGRVETIVALHHIAVDAWSIQLLANEVRAAYDGASAPAPALQYADLAAWQRNAAQIQAIEAQLRWWERRLAGAPPLSVFLADQPTTPARQQSGAVHDFRWSEELSQGIRGVAREQGATVYMILLAAVAAVLYRHTGQGDVLLGSPMGLRERPEFESMIGPFVNLLVLRLELSDDPTFEELVRRARDAVLDAHAHRDVPFEKLLERLKPARSVYSPLFQMALVQHNAPSSGWTPIFGGGAIHELTWYLREVDRRFCGSIEYRADLFSAGSIVRISTHIETLLTSALRTPGRRVSELPLLSPAERELVVHRFNATTKSVGAVTIVQEFERQAALSPDAIAVRCQGVELSYGELNRRANRLARRLQAMGVAPGALVAICLDRSLHLPVALLGVTKAGAAYVPLDPQFPAERLAFMLADSEVSVLITAGNAAGGIEMPAHVAVVDVSDDAARLEVLSDSNLEHRARPDDLAYVIYTSGSTGRPKGVAVRHGALINFLCSMKHEPGLAGSDVVAAVTTMSFDIAGLELFLPWIAGAKVELISREVAADGAALAEQLSACGATLLQATPATWRLLLEAGWSGDTRLRALCGGEALPRDLADALLDRVGELWNLYGPTETTVWSTIERVVPGAAAVRIGRPIANTQIYVLDRTGEPVPIGVPGEIWIGGAGVAPGYHRRPELTAERFVADRFSNAAGARLYRTGDLGRWDADGRLCHLGRLDYQVKIRGFRIELGEIESVLVAHETVRQAVVVAREAAPSDLRLVAYVLYEPGSDEPTVSELRRYLRRELPEYMVPPIVMALDSVPLMPNGKIDRAALPDPFKATASGKMATNEPPAPGMERMLADIWQEILHIGEVGAHSNFFELGGHSLLALRVAASVHKRTGWRMDPRALFFQTLRQIAGTVPAEIDGTAPAT